MFSRFKAALSCIFWTPASESVLESFIATMSKPLDSPRWLTESASVSVSASPLQAQALPMPLLRYLELGRIPPPASLSPGSKERRRRAMAKASGKSARKKRRSAKS